MPSIDAPAAARAGVDRVPEDAQAVDVAPQRPGTDAEALGELGARPELLRLQQREEQQSPAGRIGHDPIIAQVADGSWPQRRPSISSRPVRSLDGHGAGTFRSCGQDLAAVVRTVRRMQTMEQENTVQDVPDQPSSDEPSSDEQARAEQARTERASRPP